MKECNNKMEVSNWLKFDYGNSTYGIVISIYHESENFELLKGSIVQAKLKKVAENNFVDQPKGEKEPIYSKTKVYSDYENKVKFYFNNSHLNIVLDDFIIVIKKFGVKTKKIKELSLSITYNTLCNKLMVNPYMTSDHIIIEGIVQNAK